MNISRSIRKCLVFATALPGFGCVMTAAQNSPATPVSAPTAVPNLAASSAPQFDVASVRQNLTSVPRWRMSFTSNGVNALDVTLFYAIEEAYGRYDQQLWSGVPPWTKEKRFDIEAKYDLEKYPKITLDQRRAMLQQLLAERFRLAVHHEQKEFPLYSLTVANSGPRLVETKPADGPMCLVTHSKVGLLEVKGCAMADIAKLLTGQAHDDLGRTIVDHTGLSGRYSFTLNWTPESSPASNSLDAGGGPAILTAVKEQLGLLLQSDKGILDTIVIDHVEMPTEN